MAVLRGAASTPRRERRRPIYTAGRAALNAHPLLAGADPRKIAAGPRGARHSFRVAKRYRLRSRHADHEGSICDDDA